MNQRIVSATDAAKVGLKAAVMTTTVGARWLEDLLVQVRKGAHREFRHNLRSILLLDGIIRIDALALTAPKREQNNRDYE